jgi:hypothetical protein
MSKRLRSWVAFREMKTLLNLSKISLGKEPLVTAFLTSSS